LTRLSTLVANSSRWSIRNPRGRDRFPGPDPVAPAGGADHQPAAALETEAHRQVDRRHLLAEGALVAWMAASPQVADLVSNEPHRMNRALEGGSSDDLLRYYETTTDRMMANYERTGPVALLSPALEHFRAIRECLERPQTLAGRRRLTRTGAKLGALLGLFAFDDEWRARSWFSMARRAATEADDRTLLALAMANESLLDYWGGRERASLGSLSAAWGLVGDGGGIVAVLVAARLARAYAALGDQQALQALDDAPPPRRHVRAPARRVRVLRGATGVLLRDLLSEPGQAHGGGSRRLTSLELYQDYPNWQDHALVRLELASASLSGPDPDIEAATTTARLACRACRHITAPARYASGQPRSSTSAP
jgi:hypothetical protein